MGRSRRGGRDISGIVLLNKPIGKTSNDALQVVKRLFQANKAGHTGSLDKLASGLLPLCLGEATKLSGYLLNADKRYRARIRLGVVTSTGDAEGEVLSECDASAVQESRIRQVLDDFVGEIAQVPPMHSAIKQNGQRLYKLAHRGVVVEREPRTVSIYSIDYLGREGDCVLVDVACSKGTYIRTLAEDVGAKLGCGGSIAGLHRTGAGPFSDEDAYSLDDLHMRAENEQLDSCLLPLDTALADYPSVLLSDDSAFYLRQGQPVQVPHAPTHGLVRIFRRGEKFLGVGVVLEDGRIAPKRLIQR